MAGNGIRNPCYQGDNDMPLSKKIMEVEKSHPLPKGFNWNRIFDEGSDSETEAPAGPDGGTQQDSEPKAEKSKTTRTLVMLTALSAISSFVLGYDTGVASGVLLLVRKQFMLDTVAQELFIASTIAAAAAGAVIGGLTNGRWGRKPIILIGSMTTAFGSLGLAVAKNTFGLILGRVIVGLGIGMGSTTVPIYISEHAPTEARGALVTTSILFLTGGQFIATVVDGAFSAIHEGWRLMLGLASVTSAAQFAAFMFMPESPRWLVGQDQIDEAKQVLQLIRGKEADVDAEVKRIKDSISETTGLLGKASSGWSFLKKAAGSTPVRRALVIGAMLQIFQQLSGVNNIMYYDATIIKMSGVKDDRDAIWLATVPAAVNFCFSFVGVFLVDKLGRRPLILASLVGTLFSLILLAVAFQLSSARAPDVHTFEAGPASPCLTHMNCDPCVTDERCGFCYLSIGHFGHHGSCLPTAKHGKLLDAAKSEYGRCKNMNRSSTSLVTWAYDFCPTDASWIAFLALNLYLLFFAPGMGPLPWTINAEIYPLWARSFGNSFATTANWLTNLVVSMTFLTLSEKMTRYGVFYLYAGFTLIAIVFIYFLLPETKDKSLETVEELFEGPWCLRQQATPPDQRINLQDDIPRSAAAQHFPQHAGNARYPHISYGDNGDRVVRLEDMHSRPHMDYTPGTGSTGVDESET